MELILLQGNSKGNQEWMKEVENELKDLFDSTYIQYYRHCDTGDRLIDLDYELDILSNYLKKRKNYIILGKSAGVVLALKSISEGKISPLKCMFLGTPVLWCNKENIPIEKWIKNYKIPTFFIQKTEDRVIFAKDLKKILYDSNVNNYKFIEIPGTDHHYGNFKEIKMLMKKLIKWKK